jgi:NADPH:quinone reductase-like Zn-dependent oxidoreductase
MRAVVVRTFGDVSELVVEERPVPEPGPTEVLVRVVAAGVNPVDWWTRRGEGYLTEPPDRVGLLALTELVDAGRLRVVVDSRWPLDQVAGAHQASERGRATGKIVLTTGRPRAEP